MDEIYRGDTGAFVFKVNDRMYTVKQDDLKRLLAQGGYCPIEEEALLQAHPLGARVVLVLPGEPVCYTVSRGVVQQMLWQPWVRAELVEQEGLCYQCDRLCKVNVGAGANYYWICEDTGEVTGGKDRMEYYPPRRCCA